MKEIPVGQRCEESTVVDSGKLASSVGSGMVDVYATPMVVALFETAASHCIQPFLDEGQASVGAEINVNHSSPTPVGMKVTAVATVTAVDKRRVEFAIEVRDEAGEISSGTHVRYIIDKAKFMAKAASKKA